MNRRRFFLGHDRPASLMDKNLDMAERRRFVFLNMVVFMHLRKALHHLQMFPILLIGVDDNPMSHVFSFPCIEVIQPVSGFFSGMWDSISGFTSDAWEDIKSFFSPAVEWFSELFGEIEQTIDDIFYNIGVIAEGCWEIIEEAWRIASNWFDENVIQPISDFFSGMWDEVKSAASDAWEGIKTVFSNVASFFGDIFSEAWEKVVGVFSVAGDIFVDIKEGILTAFKEVVNGIITGINNVVAIPFNGINSALSSIKYINIMGLTPFSGLQLIHVPQIPYLARGAVLPPNKPFMAVVGDQKHGTNVEAPLATIQEAVSMVMKDNIAAMLAGFEALLQEQQATRQTIAGIKVGDTVIGQAAERYRNRLDRMHGTGTGWTG